MGKTHVFVKLKFRDRKESSLTKYHRTKLTVY